MCNSKGWCWMMWMCFAVPLQAQVKDTVSIKTVEVKGQSANQKIKEQAYAVDVLDARQLRDRNADMNRLLDAMPGVRVRETGGLGSSFNYSIHGLSGKAVRFFVDGVPMETFGAGFSINNFPVNAIDRIEVYKGVTPAQLGADALGGAINLITRKDLRNFLDASYSFGSFNTHKASLSTRLRSATGLSLFVTAAYNHSDNNYKVWGPTVEVADEFGNPITGNKYRRFNDDFRSVAVKAEAGFTNVKWADQLLLGITASGLEKGLQTGRTMAFVYGKVRYKEDFLMPSLRYAKKDLFVKGLSVNVFASVNGLEGRTTDTGTQKYNWEGKVIASNVTGELGGIYAQQSLYTFTDRTAMTVANAAYEIRPYHTISLNYTLNNMRRKGKDEIARADWTIPFREPQQLQKQVTGLSYEMQLFDERWTNVFFVKNFRYKAEANVYDYNGGQQKELITMHSRDNAWGIGYGASVHASEKLLLKFSVEDASRLPDAAELLGDGNTILNAPTLKPERSLNVNAAGIRVFENEQTRLSVETGLFFRNTRNLIWLGEGNLFGTSRYENIDKIRSAGAELAFSFSNKSWLEVSGNATYQDVRNRLKYTSSGATNIVFNDKMKNMPSFMANGEVRLRWPKPVGKGGQASFYVNTHYVERYFLNWPSLGQRNLKKIIPEQFVQDAGITYAFSENRCSITLECRNILDKQVYDNYLLQKPGRFSSIKIRYFLSDKSK